MMILVVFMMISSGVPTFGMSIAEMQLSVEFMYREFNITTVVNFVCQLLVVKPCYLEAGHRPQMMR